MLASETAVLLYNCNDDTASQLNQVSAPIEISTKLRGELRANFLQLQGWNYFNAPLHASTSCSFYEITPTSNYGYKTRHKYNVNATIACVTL